MPVWRSVLAGHRANETAEGSSRAWSDARGEGRGRRVRGECAKKRLMGVRPVGWLSGVLVVALCLAASGIHAQQAHADWPEAISDNSFFIEEAYNQDPGVVQFIFGGLYTRPDRFWTYTFTNEWPVPDIRNQLSYMVTYSGQGPDQPRGTGDTYLNYRFQALLEEKDGVAFAPRLSAIAPTGDWRKGLGYGVWGWQVALPFSKRVASHLAVHLDLGATYYPGAKALTDRGTLARADLAGTDEGTSLVWLITPRFNLLLEALATQQQQFSDSGLVERVNQALLSPGFRMAFNFRSGQLVVGAAAPFGLTPESQNSGAFLYLSWEAPVWKPRRARAA